ncbi:hypothetical protein V4R08_10190 [Nitrobacter sp. NHB1]|uniref:hypothetical protein n=1 Tax=Nitrobacter sp. NHB1 TaxID=3119830 RepID=UPI002FFDADB6
MAIVCGLVLVSVEADAGWWSRTPVDFEDCAARAKKNATSAEDKDKQITTCEAKFAGRRKPSGGYTYYDFMQNRHFDIAGPNPTAEEQKHIDEQYAAYLKDQRRGIIAAAFFRKRQQVEQAKAAVKPNAGSGNVRLTTAPKMAERRVAVLPRPRPKIASHCKEDFFSTCGWSRISTGVRDFKKVLFGSFPRKDERS